MKTKALAASICAAAALLYCFSAPARAADSYPSRPIRLIVPSNAGSGTDDSVRRAAKYMAQKVNWTTIVDNRGGGNGFVAVQEFLRAPRDGYTIFAGGKSVVTYNPVAFKDIPYDPLTDFTPAARTIIVPDTLVVSAKSGIKTVAELMARMRANPGKLFYASSGVNRVATEMFLQQSHLRATNVNYKSSPTALTDLIGGSVDFMFVDSIVALSLIHSGFVVPLAFASDQRLKALPNVPTMIESGFPGFTVFEWAGFFLPKGAPADQVNLLHKIVNDYYHTDEAVHYVDSIGGQYEDLSPAAFKTWIANELATNRTVYKRAGIEPQ